MHWGRQLELFLMLSLALRSLPCAAGEAERIIGLPRIQVATLDSWVIPPGAACWQATGSQDGAQSLMLPGTGLTLPAMNADLVRDRCACSGAQGGKAGPLTCVTSVLKGPRFCSL